MFQKNVFLRKIKEQNIYFCIVFEIWCQQIFIKVLTVKFLRIICLLIVIINNNNKENRYLSVYFNHSV